MVSSGVVSAEQQPANAATVQSDVEAVEAALRGLWDRTRKAGEVIAELRGRKYFTSGPGRRLCAKTLRA